MHKGTHILNEIVRVCCYPNMEFVLREISLGLDLAALIIFLLNILFCILQTFACTSIFFPFLTSGTGIEKRLLVKFLFF